MKIRKQLDSDKDIIYRIVKEAFKDAEHSDGKEHELVNKLRKSESYINELELVAVEEEKIVGHIMFTTIYIDNGELKRESLALAPLSVLPEYQNKGVGSRLIKEGLNKAREHGFSSVIVLGSEKFYPRFGFKEGMNFGIKAPFEVPTENFMVIELKEKALENTEGIVVYAKEFFE